jgi:hypothetical protein
MTTDGNSERRVERKVIRQSASQPVYGLGFLGALVYYISHATSFWAGVLGFFKAILWPGFLVYELLKYLQM